MPALAQSPKRHPPPDLLPPAKPIFWTRIDHTTEPQDKLLRQGYTVPFDTTRAHNLLKFLNKTQDGSYEEMNAMWVTMMNDTQKEVWGQC